MADVKYPHITVQLTGEDGNAFFIISRVRVALKKNKVPQPEITAFMNEAMSGDYQHVLSTVQKWVNVQ
jgi:hypothetical protein